MHPSNFSGAFPRPPPSSDAPAPPSPPAAGAAAEDATTRPPLDVREVEQSPRFDLNTPESKRAMAQHLEDNGFCVIGGALDREEISTATSLAWDWLESNPPGTTVRRDNIDTWHKEWLPDPINGIMSGFGFNHSEYLWFLRTRPKVREAFEAVWETTDLLVSYDGGNMFRPHEHPAGDPEWKTSGGWFHVDQNAHKEGHAGKCCVQGVLLLTDANEHTGGLCVIPRSHSEFINLCERNPMAKANKSVDYVPIPYDDPVLDQERGWSGVLVGAKAGDLVLWDSRTVHCNTPSFTGKEAGPGTEGTGAESGAEAEAEAEVEAEACTGAPGAEATPTAVVEGQEGTAEDRKSVV